MIDLINNINVIPRDGCDYDVVGVDDNHVAIIINGMNYSREDVRVTLEHDNFYKNYKLNVNVRSRNPQYELLKKSMFGSRLAIENGFFTLQSWFSISIKVDNVKLSAEADVVDNHVVIMITGEQNSNDSNDEARIKAKSDSKTKSISGMVNDILGNSYEQAASPFNDMSYEANYWLDGKKVSKEEFDKRTNSSEFFKNLDKQFSAIDKAFECFRYM